MNILKILLFNILFIYSTVAFSQSNFKFGGTAGLKLNSAILPNIELNKSINDVLEGNDVVKGVPQYAEITLNYTVGGFIKYEDKIGFTTLELTYSTSHIYKELHLDTGYLGNYTITALDRKYNYFDIRLLYNLYLSENNKLFIGLGGSSSFLLSYTKNNEPEPQNWSAFLNTGISLTDKISIQTRFELGINEVYKDSYIHHLMVPVTVSIAL